MRTRIFCKEPIQCNSALYCIIEGKFSVVPVPLENRTAEAIQAAPSAIGEEVKIGHNLSPDFLYFFRFMFCKDVIK